MEGKFGQRTVGRRLVFYNPDFPVLLYGGFKRYGEEDGRAGTFVSRNGHIVRRVAGAAQGVSSS